MNSSTAIKTEDAPDDLLEIIESIGPIADEYAPAVWKSIKMAQTMEDRCSCLRCSAGITKGTQKGLGAT